MDGDAESHCGDEQGEEGEEGLEDFPHSSSDRAGRTPIGPDRARVEQTGREVQADKDAMRPANTRKAYGKNDYSAGPKREFFQFCAAVAGEHVNGVQMDAGKISYISSVVLNPEVDPLVDDQDISLQAFVTPETVDEYFTKYLVKRGQLTSGRGRARKKREDEGDDELVDDPLYMPQPKANTHVNRGTVEQHRKALMDLWKAQKREFPNEMKDVLPPNSSPNWSDILANFEKGTSGKRRDDYDSRGLSLMRQGYSDEQHIMLCEWGVKNGSPRPDVRHHVSIAIRCHWQHTWAHSMCLRCDDRLKLQLPDVGVIQIGHQGPKPTPMLVVVMDQGKTNPNGRVDVAAALRHKDNVFECPHFALALLFHHRWTFANADFPTLESTPRGANLKPKRPWFDEFIVPGLTRTHSPNVNKMITYPTVLAEAKMALSGIAEPVTNPDHYTHLQRGTVVRMAELQGLSMEQLRRAGRWRGSGAIQESYLTGIPYDFLRLVAGYGDIGSVFVLRGELDPPQALVDQVFPQVASMKTRPRDLGAVPSNRRPPTHYSRR